MVNVEDIVSIENYLHLVFPSHATQGHNLLTPW